ncbi:subtilisin-like serine protease [Deinococcus aerius]|uniref:Subtilisin-like serine protease n=1 Tax=Deinococcus aerius TaxID=200253 RepID=A0A2I9DSW8_9DEIO|nr:S8 family serine peptidase [Deinococcus aerius]GBF05637.1 subtilisin-like serine protease [Deinococcus aerius]
MLKKSLAVVMFSSSLLACGQLPTGDQTPKASGAAADLEAQAVRRERYLVVFRTEGGPADVAARVARAGGRLGRNLSGVGVATATGDASFGRRMAADPEVLAVGPEGHLSLPAVQEIAALGTSSLDDLSGQQWDMRRIGAGAGAGRAGGRQKDVLVAVLDTGVMDDHPDLRGQLALNVGTNYCREAGGPGGASGYPVYRSYLDPAAPGGPSADACTAGTTPTYQGHGTHVAGIITGRADGEGITGVAPGVRIAAYKVFDRYRSADGQDQFGAFDGPVFAAILDAANRGAAVINMSMTSTLDLSNPQHKAMWHAWSRVTNYAARKGTLIVAAAGNSAESSRGKLAHLPSDLPAVMSVSATGTTRLEGDEQGVLWPKGRDVLAYYSNWGPSTDLAAPGGDCGTNPDNNLSWCDGPSGNSYQLPDDSYRHMILSSVIHEDGGAGYVYLSGTSMAAPHVAGVAALVKALHPDWKAGRLRAHLKATAERIGQKQTFGGGLVNADRATR